MMKIVTKLGLLATLGIMILSACSSDREVPIFSSDDNTSIPETTQEVEEAQRKSAEESRRVAEEEKKKSDAEQLKNAISINRVYYGDDDYLGFREGKTDSAGGFEVRIDWSNRTDKVIKYVFFTVEFYNAVGDRIYNSADFGTTTLKGTGPYSLGMPGKVERWGNCYNSEIAKVIITNLKIEYMDGSVLEGKI